MSKNKELDRMITKYKLFKEDLYTNKDFLIKTKSMSEQQQLNKMHRDNILALAMEVPNGENYIKQINKLYHEIETEFFII